MDSCQDMRKSRSLVILLDVHHVGGNENRSSAKVNGLKMRLLGKTNKVSQMKMNMKLSQKTNV